MLEMWYYKTNRQFADLTLRSTWTPPETAQTFQRLLGLGISREKVIRSIASALSVDIYEVLKSSVDFNEKRFVGNLFGLPTLPRE